LADLASKEFELTSEEQIIVKMKELSETLVLIDTFKFGKYKGLTFEDVNKTDQGYLKWLYKSETGKPEHEQKSELVYTLKYYLG
jgi:hypothetical protein